MHSMIEPHRAEILTIAERSATVPGRRDRGGGRLPSRHGSRP